MDPAKREQRTHSTFPTARSPLHTRPERAGLGLHVGPQQASVLHSGAVYVCCTDGHRGTLLAAGILGIPCALQHFAVGAGCVMEAHGALGTAEVELLPSCWDLGRTPVGEQHR